MLALGLVVAVAWVLGVSRSVSTVRPTIGDESFVEAANQVCAPVKRRLGEAGGEEEERSPGGQAQAVDATVDELTAMVGALGQLQPSADDAEEVAAWLESWEAVLGSGRATAEALRAGGTEVAEATGEAGEGPAEAVNRFAGANGIGACSTLVG